MSFFSAGVRRMDVGTEALYYRCSPQGGCQRSPNAPATAEARDQANVVASAPSPRVGFDGANVARHTPVRPATDNTPVTGSPPGL